MCGSSREHVPREGLKKARWDGVDGGEGGIKQEAVEATDRGGGEGGQGGEERASVRGR